MSTKQSIIESAFARCGIIPEEQGLSSAELIRMNNELNELVEIFYDDGILIPFLISDNLNDDSGLTLAQEGALANSLAINVMAVYANHRPVSQALANRAKQSKRALRNRSFNTVKKSKPSTLPRGSGNYTYGGGAYGASTKFYRNTTNLRVILSNKEPIDGNDGRPLLLQRDSWNE